MNEDSSQNIMDVWYTSNILKGFGWKYEKGCFGGLKYQSGSKAQGKVHSKIHFYVFIIVFKYKFIFYVEEEEFLKWKQ